MPDSKYQPIAGIEDLVAYIASGSVITQDVPDEGLAFGRARQSTIPGKGRELRERLSAAANLAKGKSEPSR